MRRSVALFTLAVAACSHHDAPPAAPVENRTAVAPARRAPSDLELIAIDSEAVIGINFAQLQASPLWQQYVAPKLASWPGIDKFRTICGFDPLQSLRTIALGMSHLGEGDSATGTFVVHGWDHKRAMTCFDKQGLAEAQKDGSKVVIDGDVVLIVDKDHHQIGFTFVDDTTALVVLGPDAATTASIKHIASGGMAGVNASPTFHAMYDKLDTKSSLWMLLNAQSPAFQKTRAMGVNMKAVFGSVNVSDRLTVAVRLRMNTADEANNLVTLAKSQLASPQIKTFFDKLDVTADLADVVIDVAMTDQQIAQLVGMLGMMTGVAGNSGGSAPPAP